MRILAHFNNQYGGKRTEEITFYGTLEDAKEQLYYVDLDGTYYEWVTYDSGYGGFDYISNYAKVDSIQGNHRVHRIISTGYGWNQPRCECGSARVNAPRHSRWCPMFPYQK